MGDETAANYHLTLREWPESERPRERLIAHGPSYLSNAELLAIVLRTGTAGKTVLSMAENLLAGQGGLAGLRRASVQELVARQLGLGPAKAAQLKAALELGHRLSVADQQPLHVGGAEDVAGLLMLQMADLEQEQLRLVLLNAKNDVISWPVVYTGGLRTAVVRAGEVFKEPIRQNASAIIVVHNHPSGDPTPSPEDVNLTHQLVQLGKQLDIDVIDHLIIGRGRWVSLRSKGLGFPNGRK
ncbi:MAG TPA: DNA repair protein RadC [Chloroflexota bacterium]|jgi:DNA repair protein RadC|nr:DNA repair protein RadC [Chloroflexota bacterium]